MQGWPQLWQAEATVDALRPAAASCIPLQWRSSSAAVVSFLWVAAVSHFIPVDSPDCVSSHKWLHGCVREDETGSCTGFVLHKSLITPGLCELQGSAASVAELQRPDGRRRHLQRLPRVSEVPPASAQPLRPASASVNRRPRTARTRDHLMRNRRRRRRRMQRCLHCVVSRAAASSSVQHRASTPDVRHIVVYARCATHSSAASRARLQLLRWTLLRHLGRHCSVPSSDLQRLLSRVCSLPLGGSDAAPHAQHAQAQPPGWSRRTSSGNGVRSLQRSGLGRCQLSPQSGSTVLSQLGTNTGTPPCW